MTRNAVSRYVRSTSARGVTWAGVAFNCAATQARQSVVVALGQLREGIRSKEQSLANPTAVGCCIASDVTEVPCSLERNVPIDSRLVGRAWNDQQNCDERCEECIS